MTGNFIIGFDFDEPDSVDILAVGRDYSHSEDKSERKKGLQIVNAFQGTDARVVYDILMEKQKPK